MKKAVKIPSNRKFTHKMEKTPRYTQRERNMVLGFAAQYKDIIENKRTDAESNRKKDEVWRVIAKEFNSRVYHQRTAKQLRQLYKNMKLLLKKDLSIDGRTKDFMDILNALSQQSVLHPFIYRQNMGNSEYDDEQKGTSGSVASDQIENDVVVIKSEELSDNEQSSSLRNDINDDTMSNKDIPEICMEDDDDYLINNNDDDNMDMKQNYNNNNNNNNSHINGGIINGVGQLPAGTSSSSTTTMNIKNNEQCNSLLQLAMEERKRKIELLNVQIEYWKALTRKLENTTNSNNSTNNICTSSSSSSSSTTTTPTTPPITTIINPTTTTTTTITDNNHCHCHIPRLNGINQS